MAARIGPLTGNGTDIDDTGAGAVLNERRQQRVGDVNQTGNVGVDHRFPVLQVHLLRRLRRQRQPGVVNQRFDIGKGGRQLCHRGGNGLAVTHVQLDNMYRHQQAQPVIQFLQARQATPAQHQRPARLGKHLCRCLPKTGGGPGNKHYVVGGHFTLLCALLSSL